MLLYFSIVSVLVYEYNQSNKIKVVSIIGRIRFAIKKIPKIKVYLKKRKVSGETVSDRD